MNEHNRAIRQAQRLLNMEANILGRRKVEVGYNQWVTDPAAVVYVHAAERLEALLEPEDDHDSTD